MAVLVGGAAHAGRLHDHVVDDPAGDEEVGDQDEGEYGPGRGCLDPGRLLELQIGDRQDLEHRPQDHVHHYWSYSE